MAKFYKLDVTAFLETPEQREAYLAAARELGDPELLEKAEHTVAQAAELCKGNAERLKAFEELCELTAAVPSVPWPDASAESDREALASRFEAEEAEECPFCGGTLVVSCEPLPPEDGEELAELFASGVEHQVCPCCGFVTFTEEQANEIHRMYWQDRKQRDE